MGVGKDWEVWSFWRSCVTVNGPRGFKGPGQAQCLSLPVSLSDPEDQDAKLSGTAPAPGLSASCHDQASKTESKPPIKCFLWPWCLFRAIDQ